MSQLSLFDEKPVRPKDSGISPEFIRKEMLRVVRIVRAAEIMPWPDYEMARWERMFPELAGLVPDGEGEQLLEAFTREVARLREAA